MKSRLLPILLIVIGCLLMGLRALTSLFDAGDLDVTIEKTPFIMPAAHNVYSNPDVLNGKFHLFKAKLTNNSKKTLEDVTVHYSIPGLIDRTEIGLIGTMYPGQTAVVACYPRFREDITKKTTATTENVKVEITWDGAGKDDDIEEDFTFKLLSRNELAYTCIPSEEMNSPNDYTDNLELIASFVTPNDPVVKYYTQLVQEKVMRGDQASVTGDVEDILKFFGGLYDATLRSRMVYSGTGGIPGAEDGVFSTIQHVRLPREVITGNAGLCIELSCLYASVMASAGLKPVIFLVPGHAYPGVRTRNGYLAIEPTMIGGEGIGGRSNAQAAYDKGMEELKDFFQKYERGYPGYKIMDITELHAAGVVPMALPDDDFLKSKVDRIISGLGTDAPERSGEQQRTYYAQDGGGNQRSGGGGGGGGTTSARRTQGPLSFAIPSGWSCRNRPMADFPALTSMCFSGDQKAIAYTYDIPARRVKEAMAVLQRQLQQRGATMEYTVEGDMVAARTAAPDGMYAWVGMGARNGSTTRILLVGGHENHTQRHAKALESITASIQ